MKVYIASSKKDKAREGAALVGPILGHTVVSTWHDGAEDIRPFGDFAWWAKQVEQNLGQLAVAEVAVIIAKKPFGPGLLVEAGFALGRGLPVVVFGKRLPCSLLRHPMTHLVETADQLEAKLKELEAVAKPKAVATEGPQYAEFRLPLLGVLDCRTAEERAADDAAGVTLPPLVLPAVTTPKRKGRARARVAAGG
jgi:hypothetical protein